MVSQPPTSSQEALHQAMVEIGYLRRRLPAAKVGEVLEVFDKIEWLWTKQDETQFPFNVLVDEMNAIKAEIRESYSDELDLAIGRQSPVFDQIVGLDHRIRTYSEIVVLNPVYGGLEKRLQRIEEVLPSRNYALRELLDDLRSSFNLSLKQRLEAASRYFEAGQYEAVLAECGKAEGILFTHFRTFLANFKINGLPSETGVAFGEIRKRFASHKDADGLSLSKSGRLELLVLSMFETLHYFRNLGAHDRAEEIAEEKLPEWQVRRREYFMQKPEYARLTLTLAVQIALELQALLDHQGSSL